MVSLIVGVGADCGLAVAAILGLPFLLVRSRRARRGKGSPARDPEGVQGTPWWRDYQ